MSSKTEPLVQLVITAPDPYGAALAHQMRCRMTLGVLTQLLTQAKRYVVIAAPFMQSGYGLSSGTLADAPRAALRRGVNVDVVRKIFVELQALSPECESPYKPIVWMGV